MRTAHPMKAIDPFTLEEVERSRRYHRPLYRLWGLDLAVDFAILALLAFGPLGDWIGGWLDGLPFWAEALAWPAVALAIGWVVGLPLSYWRGFVHEKEGGFSTQGRRAWVTDRVKGFLVAEVITSGMVLGVLAFARAIPGAWPGVVAPGAALLVLVLSFIAPL